MVERYRSIVDNNIMQHILNNEWSKNLVHYGLQKNQIDGTLAAAALFCPEIICIKDYVFIKMFLYNYDNEQELLMMVEKLERQYNYCKKDIEMAINSWSLADFFVDTSTQTIFDEEIFYHFGMALQYFWQMRVNVLFPNKSIVVELGNEIMGELGLCITLYEE